MKLIKIIYILLFCFIAGGINSTLAANSNCYWKNNNYYCSQKTCTKIKGKTICKTKEIKTNSPKIKKEAIKLEEGFVKITLTTGQFESITSGYFYKGSKNPSILIIEYTDPECPFCIRHHNDGTLMNSLSENDGAIISKVVQGVNHQGTEYKSLATICAGILFGSNRYYSTLDFIEGSSTTENPINTGSIQNIFPSNDWSSIKSCINSEKAISIYNNNRVEAQGIGSSGTPGNLVINPKTKEAVLVMGAYPADSFGNVIKYLLSSNK